jgi:hypothetical protein
LQRPITLALYILIAVGAVSGLYAAAQRYQVEQRNRRVELTLDYAEVKQLAQLTGQTLDDTLTRFKAVGVTSIAVTEDTLSNLELVGEVHSEPMPVPTVITVSSPETLERIKRGLAVKGLPVAAEARSRADTWFRLATVDKGKAGADDPLEGFAVPIEYSVLRPLGVGLDPAAVANVKKAGLIPVGRISNFPTVAPVKMQNVLNDLKQQGVQTVIFQGVEVLGYRGQEKDAAHAFKAAGLQYGQVEFGKQKGDEKLGIALKGEYVRVHSISEGEMATLDENEAIDRFVRAARERNIRLCYVRMLTMAGADPVAANVEYVRKISTRIARGSEMQFGAAHLFEETNATQPVFAFIALCVGAGLTLLVMRVVPLPDGKAWILLFLSAGACAGTVWFLGESGRKLVALLAALVFPTLACIRRDVLSSEPAVPVTQAQAAGRAISGIIAASAVTALGIISVVGLLASRTFIVKANQFLGIKAAHAVPLLVVGVLAITGLPKLDRPWADEWAKLKERVGRFFSEPMRVGQLALAIVALAALVMIVARTGNEPGVGVSGLELKFRALLDRLLPVRPRTKEFLIGHPAFVLAIALWFRGRRKWILPIFVVGVIGQVSILNTFCHTHTPLHLSLIRDVTGLVFGTVLGLALFWIIDRFLPHERPVDEASQEPRSKPEKAVVARPVPADG